MDGFLCMVHTTLNCLLFHRSLQPALVHKCLREPGSWHHSAALLFQLLRTHSQPGFAQRAAAYHLLQPTQSDQVAGELCGQGKWHWDSWGHKSQTRDSQSQMW